MPHADIHSIPDDPHRVATPYCAPGEVEPPDAPQVSDREAVARVLAVLKTDAGTAFGQTADDWSELLTDYVATGPLEGLYITLLEWRTTHDIRRDMEIFIGNQANEFLAEMSPEELEREGFPV